MIFLKRSSAAGPRSTFMRKMAPSQEASKNSASSAASKRESISPAACASAMHRERDTPFPENGLETFAQELALRAGLKAEVTNQAAPAPFCALQYSGDDVEITPQPLSPGKRLIDQCFVHQE